MNPESQQPEPLISRRKFLKLVGAFTGVAAGLALSPQPVESGSESPENENQPLINAVVTLYVTNPDGSVDSGEGSVIEQYGDYYIATADHVLTNMDYFLFDSNRTVRADFLSGESMDLEVVKHWFNTPPHENDVTEYGIRFYKLRGDNLDTIHQMMKDKTLEPIYFDQGSIRRKGQKVAIIRKDQPPGKQIQRATIVSNSNLLPAKLENAINPTYTGEYSFTLEDEDGQAIICAGMSGGPVLLLDPKGNLTNRALGLIISVPGFSDQDALGTRNNQEVACSNQVFVRPMNDGLLRRSDNPNRVLGADVMRGNVPMPKPKSDVIRVIKQ